jgi:hypothetical protein
MTVLLNREKKTDFISIETSTHFEKYLTTRTIFNDFFSIDELRGFQDLFFPQELFIH